jgi:hypothetical protein
MRRQARAQIVGQFFIQNLYKKLPDDLRARLAAHAEVTEISDLSPASQQQHLISVTSACAARRARKSSGSFLYRITAGFIRWLPVIA